MTRFIAVATIVVVQLALLACAKDEELFPPAAFAPTVAMYSHATPGQSRTYSAELCAQDGAYLATEHSATLHHAVANKAFEAGGGSEWYVFLGGTTRGSTAGCGASTVEAGFGVSIECHWRWDQGRWLDLRDDPAIVYHKDGSGFTFHVGNYFEEAEGLRGIMGPADSSFNAFDFSSADLSLRRPNGLCGTELLAVGTESTSVWSDNTQEGKYYYKDYTSSYAFYSIVWNSASINNTRNKFYTVCAAQLASRNTYEMSEVTELDNNWMVLYSCLLLILLVTIMLMIVICQEREDGDEPYEEAPEWVVQQEMGVQQKSAFVSQKSFRMYDPDDDDANADEEDRLNAAPRE